MNEALRVLKNASLTFGDLCLYVFDAHNFTSKGWWWDNFYKLPEVVQQVLLWMASKQNSKLACQTVKMGMIKVVKDIIEKEANEITKCGILWPLDNVDTNFTLGIKFTMLPDVIKENCLTMFWILLGIIKTDC
jgi:hypothetical protein